jgi:hypothetical protein
MNFADMDRFQQKAIAAAAGINDMNEAQRIFGMNMGQSREYQERMDRTTNIQDNFNKAVEATIPLQEKFSILMAEFAVLVEPLLEGVGMFIDLLIDMVSFFSEGEKVFIGASLTIGLLIAALFSAGPALGAAAAAFVGAGGAIATAVATIGGGIGVLAGGLGGLATAATASSVGMGLLAGAATVLGAVSFAGIVSGLAQVAGLIEDNIQLQNTLENLALYLKISSVIDLHSNEVKTSVTRNGKTLSQISTSVRINLSNTFSKNIGFMIDSNQSYLIVII